MPHAQRRSVLYPETTVRRHNPRKPHASSRKARTKGILGMETRARCRPSHVASGRVGGWAWSGGATVYYFPIIIFVIFPLVPLSKKKKQTRPLSEDEVGSLHHPKEGSEEGGREKAPPPKRRSKAPHPQTEREEELTQDGLDECWRFSRQSDVADCPDKKRTQFRIEPVECTMQLSRLHCAQASLEHSWLSSRTSTVGTTKHVSTS